MRRRPAWPVLAVLLVLLGLAAGCSSSPPAAPSSPATSPVAVRTSSGSQSSAAPGRKPLAAASDRPAEGSAGRYQVGQRQLTFTEPAHTGVTGQHLGERVLITEIYFPASSMSSSRLASGRFPLLMFAPGFMQCDTTYAHLLRTWAGAGYVVAGVNFPQTSCRVGDSAYEPDLVNQPADVSYVLGQLLADSAAPGNFFSGHLNSRQVAAAGQSDGGDTVAAMAGNTCCRDYRLKAVAVLSGAEWPPMPGEYFTTTAPPVLYVQGSADPINPPEASQQLYTADTVGPRYYLDLFGANHMIPYAEDDSVERLVARVTLAFFARYVLGQPGALTAMSHDSDHPGISALYSGSQPAPS
jgi:predicted dienelactone hydrolase